MSAGLGTFARKIQEFRAFQICHRTPAMNSRLDFPLWEQHFDICSRERFGSVVELIGARSVSIKCVEADSGIRFGALAQGNGLDLVGYFVLKKLLNERLLPSSRFFVNQTFHPGCLDPTGYYSSPKMISCPFVHSIDRPEDNICLLKLDSIMHSGKYEAAMLVCQALHS
ncbi:uncharacterized protein LOC104425343 [Eucalyptus grandis]|uniref:uncharacterized protein LOC104425343 n=1 Tax=Eucalyptus grandis TaxID=71139 RepID=UPI00192F0A5D|nr:uncharacterized protein LOC104425343 [Eucalyptus grandis]